MILPRRSELRLVVVVGLSAAFGALNPVPDAYYMPLAVVAVMAGSYGGSLRLALQRLLGSLLGSLILLVSATGLSVPLPLALAVALTLMRLLGGSIGLASGYKVGGNIIVMGWLVHTATLTSWVPLRLLWTCVGVIVGMLAMRLIWPSRAISQRHQTCRVLLEGLAGECRRQGHALEQVAAGDPPIRMRRRGEGLQEERSVLQGLRQTLPEAITELGPHPLSHPLARFWEVFDGCCSTLIGLLESLRTLPPVPPVAPPWVVLRQAEAELLLAIADRLEQWHRGFPIPPRPRELPELEHLHRCRCAILAADPAQGAELLSAGRQRQVARRLTLAHQAGQAIETMEEHWAELRP